MLLSLIMPVCNGDASIDETLRSILPQLPENCELVIVDDGSDDGTKDHLRSLPDLHANIKTVFTDHGGVSHARNEGIRTAAGDFLAFMDCHHRMKDGFFESWIRLPHDADLYLFGFDRAETDGSDPALTEKEGVSRDTSDFADDCIRSRHLPISSACHRIYRKAIIDQYRITFQDDLPFGADQLFNCDFCTHCRRIRTLSLKMAIPIRRQDQSSSESTYRMDYDTVLMLHHARTDCFLSLSKGTDFDERNSFAGDDITNEIRNMIGRFDAFPEEKSENLPKLNQYLFGESDAYGDYLNYIIVLGSTHCLYRVERAMEFVQFPGNPVFVVSGGNLYKDNTRKEAEFMADFLISAGMSKERILVEDQARFTLSNLELSKQLIDEHMRSTPLSGRKAPVRIGILTAGFHIPRTRMNSRQIHWPDNTEIVFIPAYGEHTSPDHWYADPVGVEIVLDELKKVISLQTQLNTYEGLDEPIQK